MQIFSMRDLVQSFITSLVGNFAISRVRGAPNKVLELSYIREIENIRGQYTFTHFLMTDKEIELKADVICYHLTEDDTVEKYNMDTITLDIDKTDIIPVTNDSVVSLLLDNNRVVREAAEDWYETAKLGRVLSEHRRGRLASQ